MKRLAAIIFLGLTLFQPAGISQDDGADAFQFLRRIYLRLADRTPNIEEVNQFIREGDIEALTGRLLAHDDFLKSRERFWANYLKITNPQDITWLREEITNNTPVDDRLKEWFATQRPGSPDSPSSIAALAEVGPSLLGINLECAQCHDHPFEKWKMMDFMQLAGFMNNAGLVVVPPGYLYTDAKPGDIIPAETPFGAKFKMTIPPSDLKKIKADDPWPENGRARRSFGNWLTNFRANSVPLEILGAHYGEWLTGRSDLVAEVWKNRDDSSLLLRELSPMTRTLKLSKYDELSLIQSFVKGPVFTRKASAKGEMRSTLMTRDQWLDSIESSLGVSVSNREEAPGPLAPFLSQAEFVDALLATHDLPADQKILNIWLATLTRPPRPNEVEHAEQMRAASPEGTRDLYGTIFLSDEFQSVP